MGPLSPPLRPVPALIITAPTTSLYQQQQQQFHIITNNLRCLFGGACNDMTSLNDMVMLHMMVTTLRHITPVTAGKHKLFASILHLLSQSKSKSKVQVQVKSQKSKGLGVTLFCCCTTHPPQKLFSATRHPIERKFSQ